MKSIILLILFSVLGYSADRYYFEGYIAFDNASLRNTAYNYIIANSTPDALRQVFTYDIPAGTIPAHYDIRTIKLRFTVGERFWNKLTDYANGLKNNSHILWGRFNTGGGPYNYNEIVLKP